MWKGRVFNAAILVGEVVDAEDLLFVEDLVHCSIELHGSCEVGAECLLYNHLACCAPDRRRLSRSRRARL